MRAGDARVRVRICYTVIMGWENFTPEYRREYDRRRYLANRDERLRQMAEYRQAHREELREKARMRRIK